MRSPKLSVLESLSGSASGLPTASHAIRDLPTRRMTGWEQEGSFAPAGHDLNYIALTAALHHIGCKAHRLCRRLL